MFVLGIDPGLTTTGYGLVERASGKLRARAVGVIRTDPGRPTSERLYELHRDLVDLLTEHRPDSVAIEQVFVNRNLQTAMSVARASGVVLLAAAGAGVPVHEYQPTVVKSAVTGDGRAGKQQVQDMVMRRLRLDALPGPADASDALAVALCHLQALMVVPG